MATTKHPLINKKVNVVWAEDEPGRPTTLYVAFVDDRLRFIRFADNNTWSKATWISWVCVDDIVQMDEVHETR